MGREKSIWCWCLVSFTTVLIMDGVMSSHQYHNKSCTPSRCGVITNVSHPFRLRHDPPNCGDPSYEIAGENDVAHVRLYNGSYRVLGINYNNYTILVVDPGIEEGNCSSLPRYFLYRSNFSDSYYKDSLGYDISKPYGATLYSYTSKDIILFKPVVYMKCSDAVRDDAAFVDTAHCVMNWESEGEGEGGGHVHVYAVAGDLLAQQLRSECRVKLVAPITSDWDSLVPRGIRSYAVIHSVLSLGFEVSWSTRGCTDLCPTGSCYFSFENRSYECYGGG